ncbi:hypothetical protein BDF22DRAFT_665039 [Syncephalis plumigaleata]|nr:hypothetical protein BDF22DRAFT_665039 [Syncephalis plumigaleata]
MMNTTRRGSEDKSERTNNTSFGVHDASLIQLDPSMERDIGVEQQWHSSAATSPVLAPTAVKAQQNKPSSPSMVVTSTQNLPSPDSPRITPVTSNAAIGRAMGRAQMSPSPSSPPKNGRIAVASTAAELAFNEGVMGGARAAAHARSRSAASPLLRPTATQSPPLSAVSAISGATSNGNNNGVSSGTSTPYASRPVSPRLRFEESLLSPNASSEIALSRSSSRSSNTSNWDSRLPPPINVASNPVGRSVGTPITTTFAPYNHQNNGSNGSVGGGHQPTRFAQLGGTSRCFKCNQRLYAIDEVPGPRATKWHRNCLACLVCRKPLDSMALMRDDTDGPYCRMCYIKKGRRVTALM